MKDLFHTKLNLIDLNGDFRNNHDIFTQIDSIPENGIKAIVKSLRNNLINLNVEINDCALSFRPKQNRQTLRSRQKDVSNLKKLYV